MYASERFMGRRGILLDHVFEESFDVSVVWLLLEVEGEAIFHKLREFIREFSAELVHGNRRFLLENALIFLSLRRSFIVLPRQTSSHEVDQRVSERYQIIPTALLVVPLSVHLRYKGVRNVVTYDD